MSLQSKTIQRYRSHFPNETLRETSKRTGIQITRLFRLYHGKTMKVCELEAFDYAIENKKTQCSHIVKLSEILDEAGAILTDKEINWINNYISRRVDIKKTARLYYNITTTNIA